MSSLSEWVRLPMGYTRTFRVKTQELAQRIKLNAMVMSIKVVKFEQNERGYWMITLLSNVKPSPQQTQSLTKSKLY